MNEPFAQGHTDPNIITLFRGWSRLSTDPHGEMRSRPLEGFFQAGTRLLTHYRLRVNGRPLLRTYSLQHAADQWCGIFLIPPGPSRLFAGDVPHGSIEVSVLRRLETNWDERIRVRSFNDQRTTIELAVELGCPVSDVEFEEEMKSESENDAQSEFISPRLEWKSGLPALYYERDFGFRRHAPTLELKDALGTQIPKEGDRVLRGISIHCRLNNPDGLPVSVDVRSGKISEIRFKVELASKTHVDFAMGFFPWVDGKMLENNATSGKLDAPSDDTLIVTGNSTLNRVIARAQKDLKLLRLPHARSMAFSAGIPRYIGVFGRDTLTTAWQAGLFSPGYLEPALSVIGQLRGVRFDPWRDEEPDRILHERRLNPRAAVGESNREIYYGDVAATPFWIVTLAAAYNWTGDRKILKRHEETFESCCRWMERRLNEGKGFVYYAPTIPDAPGSNRNQAWKDSDDAIVDSQGGIRTPPIATAEIQGYCHLALLSAVEVALALGQPSRARKFKAKAASLKRRFNERFWMPKESFFAMALCADSTPVDSIASNIGHCLGTGIIDREKVPSVVKRLSSTAMFSGWGIRTLSSDNPAYDPFSYHRGSVWPVENSTIAAGFAICGHVKEAVDLIEAQFDLATLFPNLRLPEVISGHERSADYPAPGLYPQANLLQAWSVSAISLYMQILLGIRPFAPIRALTIKPILPSWIPWVELHRLRVGKAMVSLRFWRDDSGKTRWKVIKREGFLFVLEQPPDLSDEATIGRRIRDGLRAAGRTRTSLALLGVLSITGLFFSGDRGPRRMSKRSRIRRRQ